MNVRYKVSCPDEFPNIVEEDTYSFLQSMTRKEIAIELAECYLVDYIHDWDDEGTQPGDLFHITAYRDLDRVYVVEFRSNSPHNNSHIPDHIVLVELLHFS
jgi:hypothetical protein